MGTIDGAKIEVVNWDLYNPRTDSKRPNWFRLENTIATGPGFFDLDCDQKWLWVFILSLVSQKNGEAITWSCSFCQSLTKIRPQKQEETIELYEKYARLRVSRNVTSELPCGTRTLRTDGRTDITDGQDEHLLIFDFERIYDLYPRRVGKAEGLKRCEREIKKAEDYDQLESAVRRYAGYCEAQKTDPKYIKHFSSFMSSWRDWLDPATGTSSVSTLAEDRFAFLDRKGGA